MPPCTKNSVCCPRWRWPCCVPAAAARRRPRPPVRLARSGYYDNTTIWRSEYGFAVQGGDATGTGTGGSTIWSNNPYPLEADAGLKHYAGALCAAFAAGGDATGGNSQFYFVTALPDSVSSSDLQADLTANGYTDAQVAAYAAVGG